MASPRTPARERRRHEQQQRQGRPRRLGAFALRGGRTSSGLAAAQGAAAGGAGAAGGAQLGASLGRRPGAVLRVHGGALVLPGAGSAPGPGESPAAAAARRRGTRAVNVAGADRRAARSVQGPSLVVGPAPLRQSAGAGRRRARARSDAVLAGDNRLLAKLRSEELQPVASRTLVHFAASPTACSASPARCSKTRPSSIPPSRDTPCSVTQEPHRVPSTRTRAADLS